MHGLELKRAIFKMSLTIGAGYDLIRAAKLVIDTVRECIWTYWFHDTLQTQTHEPVPESTQSVHTLAAPPPKPGWIRPADQWLDDCYKLVGIDTATVGCISTQESLVSSSGPSATVISPGPSAPISSQGPRALVLHRAPAPSYRLRAPAPLYHVRAHVPPLLIRAHVPTFFIRAHAPSFLIRALAPP